MATLPLARAVNLYHTVRNTRVEPEGHAPLQGVPVSTGLGSTGIGSPCGLLCPPAPLPLKVSCGSAADVSMKSTNGLLVIVFTLLKRSFVAAGAVLSTNPPAVRMLFEASRTTARKLDAPNDAGASELDAGKASIVLNSDGNPSTSRIN